MNKKSVLSRIIPFALGVVILTIGFFQSQKLNLTPDFFNFLWTSIVSLYILIFVPIFISAFIPRDLRKESFLGMMLLISQVSLFLTIGIVNIFEYIDFISKNILIIASLVIIFIYIVNISFIFLSTTHKQRTKIQPAKTNSLSWINNAQAQLENLVRKSEKLNSEYSELKPRILQCYEEAESLTPINNATALKFEHQILDSVVDLISAIDQVLAGNSVNLEEKTSTLENHIRQRQNLTLY